MPEAAKKPSFSEATLTQYSPTHAKLMAKLLAQRGATDGKMLERKRNNMATISLTLEGILDQLLSEAKILTSFLKTDSNFSCPICEHRFSKPLNTYIPQDQNKDAVHQLTCENPSCQKLMQIRLHKFDEFELTCNPTLNPNEPKFAKLSNAANLLGLMGVVQGLELVVDCLSKRKKIKIKTADGIVEGYTRFGAGDLLHTLVAICTDEEEGVLANLNDICAMQNDIGIKTEAFPVEKYLSPETKPAAEEVLSPSEGIATTELEEDKHRQAAEFRGKIR